VSTSLGAAAGVAYVIGALLVLWSAYIHFHLWNETGGYRHIPTIGPLFLAQSIGGLVVGIVVVAVRRVWAAVIGMGFAASTLIGFLLTVGLTKGLFNFKESWAAPTPVWHSPSRSPPLSCSCWPGPCASSGLRPRLAPLLPQSEHRPAHG
jgi:hypothetical protein